MLRSPLLLILCLLGAEQAVTKLVFHRPAVNRAVYELGQLLPKSVARADAKSHKRYVLWDGDALLIDPSSKSRPFAFNVTKISGLLWTGCSTSLNTVEFHRCFDVKNASHRHICKHTVLEATDRFRTAPKTYVLEGDHAHLVRFTSAAFGCIAEIVLAQSDIDNVAIVNAGVGGLVVPLIRANDRPLKSLLQTLFA